MKFVAALVVFVVFVLLGWGAGNLMHSVALAQGASQDLAITLEIVVSGVVGLVGGVIATSLAISNR